MSISDPAERPGATAARTALLASVSEHDVIPEPFPHIIIENALPLGTLNQLNREWPADAVIRDGLKPGSNRRFTFTGEQILQDARIAESWRSFAIEHASTPLFRDVVRAFDPWISAEYPALIERFGRTLEGVRVGMRNVTDQQQCDLLIDVQLAINTPVTLLPTSVRSVHIDHPAKLFAGLFYLRSGDDRDSRGGDLELYRLRPGARPRFYGFQLDPRCVEVTHTIAYRSNTLVLILNTPRSFHGVTPRFPTPHTRRFVNILGQMAQPLFSVNAFQGSRLRSYLYHYRRWLLAWRP